MPPVLPNKMLPMAAPKPMDQEVVRVGHGAPWSASVSRTTSSGPKSNALHLAVIDKGPSKAKILNPHSRVDVPSLLHFAGDIDDLAPFVEQHLAHIATSLATGALPDYRGMAAESPFDHNAVMTAIASMGSDRLVATLNARVGALTARSGGKIAIVKSTPEAFGCKLAADHVVYLAAVTEDGRRPFAITDTGCQVHPGVAEKP